MSENQIISCPFCGAKNRVDLGKVELGTAPVCGRCKKPLPAAVHPINVTDVTYSSEVEGSPVPVLLDMWAPWCGPCRMLAPRLEELAFELSGRVRIAKLNVDENPVTAGRFNVRSIPTMLVLLSGREVDRLVGLLPKEEIRQRLENAVARSKPAARGH